MTLADQIRLELPANPRYGRVARIAAAHLALRRGFSLHEIDELRQVMDEAVTLLGGGGGSDTLRVDYGGDGQTILIEAMLRSESAPAVPTERIDRFSSIAGDLVDDYAIDPSQRQLRFTKAKV